jgi:hypothetical protein
MKALGKTIPIQYVTDFIAHLTKGSSSSLRLFRGQNTDKSLLPGIMRLARDNQIPPNEIDDIEQRMLNRFRKESVPMLPERRDYFDWELMAIAQHWGMPTRLLDWTSNALAGLWFAVSTAPPIGNDQGVVWVIDEPNERAIAKGDNIFELNKTCFFQPPHIDRRIVAQSSWFSVYRHNRTEYLPLERQARYAYKVTKFTIIPDRFEMLRKELRLLGVHHASLFPDLYGLGRDIQTQFIDFRP